jgi:hypothetical protein
VADPSVVAIESLRIDAVKLSHAAREVALHRFRDHMVMVAHLTPGMTDPVMVQTDQTEKFEPEPPVRFIEKKVFTAVATRSHMIESAGEFYA